MTTTSAAPSPSAIDVEAATGAALGAPVHLGRRRSRAVHRAPRRRARPVPGAGRARPGRTRRPRRQPTGLAERYVREWRRARLHRPARHRRRRRRHDRPLRRSPRACADAARRDLAGVPGPARPWRRTVGAVLPRLAEAFRTGAGVPYADYGRTGQRQARSTARRTPRPGRRVAARRCRTSPRASPTPRARPPSPTWAAAPAGRRSSWPRRSRTSPSTASTTTRHRSTLARRTRRRARRWPTGSGSRCPTSATRTRTQRRYDVALLFECLHDMADPDRSAAQRAPQWRRAARCVMDERADENS